MATLFSQLFLFPGCLGRQPTKPLNCLGPEPLLSLELLHYDAGPVEREARARTGRVPLGPQGLTDGQLFLVPLLALGQGGLVDILGAL